MAITITPDEATGLTDITRPNFAMNQTVSASATAAAGQEANVTSVTASVAGTQPDLVITSGTTSVNIGGTLQDPFNDQFTYVEKGTDPSLYPKTPVTVTQVGNMPSDKLMYNLNQDNAEFVTKGLFVTVTYEDTNGVAQPNVYFYPEVKLYNSYERIRSFISNYYT